MKNIQGWRTFYFIHNLQNIKQMINFCDFVVPFGQGSLDMIKFNQLGKTLVENLKH